MEELLELKNLIQTGDHIGALDLVEELLEMSKKDIINNIYSFAVILLLHLIKRRVEQRTTRSWDVSIKNTVLRIQFLNRRHKKRSQYLDANELAEVLEDAWQEAVNQASREVFEGILEPKDIAARVHRDTLVSEALTLLFEVEKNLVIDNIKH